MSIKELYQQANLSPHDFQEKTGVSQQEFNDLLPYFSLFVPRKILIEERLFAILYANKFRLSEEAIGRILLYSKGNEKSNGGKFIEKGSEALLLAREKLREASSRPIIEHQTQNSNVKSVERNFPENIIESSDEPINTNTQLMIDREFIKRETNNIFTSVPLEKPGRNSFVLQKMYYNINQEISHDELHSTKWKTYIYLRKCVLDYRNGERNELKGIIHFLNSNTEDKKWFTQRLMDKSVQIDNDLWGSGEHEWLERCLIVDVLKRSAGMVDGVESETGIGCIAPDYDWLYYQATIRSHTKYILFKNTDKTIENGHSGAVKERKHAKGFSSKGSPHFHELLCDAFYTSKTIEGFLKLVRNIFKQELYSGKKRFNKSSNKKYLIDGSKTNNLSELSFFRKNKLFSCGYLPFKESLSSAIDYATNFGNNEKEDISEVASDTTEESDNASDVGYDSDDQHKACINSL